MTVSPDAPPLAFDALDDAVRALRNSGLRLSTPRRLVLEALFEAEGPVSAAYLARKLSIDESSVYRNLEMLEYRGLIHHVHLGHSPGLYVLASDQEAEYLYCERCAKVTAVTPGSLDSVRDAIRHEFGYTTRFTHFAIVGVCEQCAAAPGAITGSEPDAVEAVGPEHHHDPGSTRAQAQKIAHEHLHSHGDHVHSHAHAHPPSGTGRHAH